MKLPEICNTANARRRSGQVEIRAETRPPRETNQTWVGESKAQGVCQDFIADAYSRQQATYRVQGVGQAGHQLGLDELAVAALELGLLLHGEAGGLHAELLDLVVARLQLGQVCCARLQHRAGVGNARALDLEIGQSLQLVVGQGAGRLRTESKGCRYTGT